MKDLSLKELENLGYYDFMGYIGTPFFHIGGIPSTERLVELCKINKTNKILVLGCGTGFSACHIAKKYRCSVIGIDIAEIMIMKARERAQNEKIGDKIDFQVGDAYNLDFKDNDFDIVITEFVTQFLNRENAFKEFYRVLKPGGYVSINELFKDESIPKEIDFEILNVEQVYSVLTGLPFKLYTTDNWRSWFEMAGFKNIYLEENKQFGNLKDRFSFAGENINSMGGFSNFYEQVLIPLFKVLKYVPKSKTIRNRIIQLGQAKNILLNNKRTSRYIGYLLCIGKKD